MGVVNFDIVQANGYIGLPESNNVGNDNSNSGGKIFYVNNATTGLPEGAINGSNTNSGLSPLEPFATADYAVGVCLAGRGDKIYLLPGHAETYSSAGALALDVANVEIIGIGVGDNRPTFTFSNTAATIAQSGNSTKLMNVILVPSVDSVVSPLAITGDGCEFDVVVKDASDTVEFVRGVLATGADRLKGKIEYHGRTGGNACVNAVRLVGCAGVDLDVNCYGLASTAWVEFLTTACTDVIVSGYMYNSGTTNGSKDIIDTATGSTWYGYVNDGSAGAIYSGGSASAWASDDASAITANLATLQAEVSGGAGIATFPAGAAAANGVSLAEVIRYIQDQVINGTGTVLDTNTSLYGVLAGASGIPTFPAAAAPANSVSLAEVIRSIYDRQLGDGTNAGTNSLLGKRVSRTTADVITGAAVPLYTVTGKVLLTLLNGEVTTVIGAGATNAKFQFNPTTGTTNDMCANLDIDADEAGALYSISGTAGDAMLRSESGAIRNMSSNGMILNEGEIEFITGADRTGSIKFELFYIPLTDGATVVAA